MMAANNPDARFRELLTLEDHHAYRMQADPLRRLDFCLKSGGGAAVMVTSAERAKALLQTPVLFSGIAMGAPRKWGMGMFGGNNISEKDFASAGQRPIAEDLSRYAGMGASDVVVPQISGHFTPIVLMGFEDFLFVPTRESGRYAEDGNPRSGGPIPVDTHGRNLAEVYLHGMTHVFEATRQLRRTPNNQVDGTQVTLVVTGSSPTPSGGILLRRAS